MMAAVILLLALCIVIIARSNSSSKSVVAVVSLMHASRGGRPYQRMRGLFLYSLRHIAGYTGPILFLVTGGAPHFTDTDLFTRFGAQVLPVDLVKQPVLHPHHQLGYEAVLSKLHAWALTDYERIIFYDSDTVFFQDPAVAALAACGGGGQTQPPPVLCATRDAALARAAGRPLFNAGFLVLRPDMAVHADLLRSVSVSNGQFFPEQVGLVVS